MTADDAREQLESAIWQTDPPSIYHVRAILAAADNYAATVTAEALAGIDHEHGCRITEVRQAALLAGDGKHYGSTVT
jgi:hypothetical protein